MDNLVRPFLFGLLFCGQWILGSALHVLDDAGTTQGSQHNRSIQFTELPAANSSSGLGESTRHRYLTNSELEESMKKFVRKCQNVSRMYSIGYTVLGVPLVSFSLV
eukprot:TRINITY_DN8675_c0_g1_i1.p1 TRINITY_DN8675_c0_g1~~TRINITY_DN8675_c0_g1_i1.p1  ORF type:complete len:106 (+),score=7.52 TRINITY_DN8675_c0_g1_i1:79-396(+)